MWIFWSEEARLQLRSLVEYISRDSPARAEAYLHKIESKTLRLKRFPQSGRIVPELKDESNPPREIIIDHYRLIYRISSNTLQIILLFDGRRPFSQKL